VLGILALTNVVIRAVLTAPGPFNLIHAEVPNLMMGTFPFLFIPGFFVPPGGGAARACNTGRQQPTKHSDFRCSFEWDQRPSRRKRNVQYALRYKERMPWVYDGGNCGSKDSSQALSFFVVRVGAPATYSPWLKLQSPRSSTN